MSRLVTEKDMDASYNVLGLLAVCEHAARNLEHLLEQAAVNMGTSIAHCLALARELASQVHDALESNLSPCGGEVRS